MCEGGDAERIELQAWRMSIARPPGKRIRKGLIVHGNIKSLFVSRSHPFGIER